MRSTRSRRARVTLAAVGLLHGCVGLAVGTANPAAAQVVLDGSLGAPGALPVNNRMVTIPADRGRQAGGNLFHSFSKFNVAKGETATFAVPFGVGRIVARATDGTRSTIDGKVTADPRGVDFHFMNPSGILVGPDATFDFGGVVVLTTADRLTLQGGAVFNARPDAAADAALTTAPPTAFGFLGSGKPAGVEINKTGAANPVLHEEGKPPQAYAIVAGPVTLRGVQTVKNRNSQEKRPARFDLISVGSGGEVLYDLADGTAEPQGLSSFSAMGDIEFSDDARIEVGSLAAGETERGRILIRGGNLRVDESNLRVRSNSAPGIGVGVDIDVRHGVFLLGESSIRTSTQGPANGGTIELTADRLEMNGGHIRSDVDGSGTGRGGDIVVTANSIRMAPSGLVPAEIVSVTFAGARGSDEARGGDVRVTSATAIVMGAAETAHSRIFSEAVSDGDAGTVSVDAPGAEGLSSAAVFSTRYGGGSFGTVLLNGAPQVLPASAVSFDGSAGAAAGPVARTPNDDGSAGGTFAVDVSQGVFDDGNLFYSFDQLSLTRQETLTFDDGGTPVTHIVARVTGGEASTIDGTLHSAGGATLFVINPAGVTVGPAGRLDVGGSVVLSSASAVRFSGGGRFGVGTAFAGEPVGGTPNGLDFTDGAGPVSIVGRPFTSSNPDKIATRLQVGPNSVLTLAGGGVTIQSRKLVAEGDLRDPSNSGAARINVLSFGSAGSVTFDPGSASAPVDVIADRFGPVTMADKAILDASGVAYDPDRSDSLGGRGGRIDVRGDSVSMTGGSLILSTSSGGKERVGGLGIDVRATGDMLVEESLVATLASEMSDGGRVDVHAGNLTIVGNGGDVLREFELDAQGLFTNAMNTEPRTGTGRGGDIGVNVAGRMAVLNAGKVQAQSNSTGDGGHVDVFAEHVLLDNQTSTDFTVIAAQSSEPNSGRGGNVSLGRDGRLLTLELWNGAAILANTLSKSDGGSLFIRARKSVTLDGSTSPMQAAGEPRLTSIDATSRPFKSESDNVKHGDAGSIDLKTGVLLLRGFAEITTGTQTSGKGGSSKIVARAVEMRDSRFVPDSKGIVKAYNPGIFAGTGRFRSEFERKANLSGVPLGDGGKVELRAGTLTMRDGGSITSSTSHEGNAGSIVVRVAGLLLIEGTVHGEPSAIESRSSRSNDKTVATGDAAELKVRAGTLRLLDGGRLRSDSRGYGNSGRIRVYVDRALEMGDATEITTSVDPAAEVIASGQRPVAGGVTVRSGGTIVLRDGGTSSILDGGTRSLPARARIAALNTRGDAGSLKLTAPVRISLTNAEVTTFAGGAGGDIGMRSFLMVLDDSTIVADAVAADAGNIDFRAHVVNRNSTLSADSISGSSDVDFFAPPESEIIGQLVVLREVEPGTPVALEPLCHTLAGAGVSSFVAPGRGGGPDQPGAWDAYLPLTLQPAAAVLREGK